MIQFIAMHWGKEVLDQMQVDEPSDQDYMDYAQRHGTQVPMPSVFFKARHVDVPATIPAAIIAHLE
jgi:hypothetical protein